MAKTQIVKLRRFHGVVLGREYITIKAKQASMPSMGWYEFRQMNPIICRGLRRGQTRKLKRTQLKNGFKLERM